jgi:hypothetical protein
LTIWRGWLSEKRREFYSRRFFVFEARAKTWRRLAGKAPREESADALVFIVTAEAVTHNDYVGAGSSDPPENLRGKITGECEARKNPHASERRSARHPIIWREAVGRKVRGRMGSFDCEVKRGPSTRLRLARDDKRRAKAKAKTYRWGWNYIYIYTKSEERFLVAAQANCVRLLRSLGMTTQSAKRNKERSLEPHRAGARCGSR